MSAIKTREDFAEEAAVERLSKRLAECGIAGWTLITVRPSGDGGLNFRESHSGLVPAQRLSLYHAMLGKLHEALVQALAKAVKAEPDKPALTVVQ